VRIVAHRWLFAPLSGDFAVTTRVIGEFRLGNAPTVTTV
jgi:hypothetical protein